MSLSDFRPFNVEGLLSVCALVSQNFERAWITQQDLEGRLLCQGVGSQRRFITGDGGTKRVSGDLNSTCSFQSCLLLRCGK